MLAYFSKANRRRRRIEKNNRRLQQEVEFYHAIFRQRQLVIPTTTDLEQFFAGRYPDRQQRTTGRLGIAAIFQHYNWEKEALLPGLEKFGRVHHFDRFTTLDPKKSNSMRGKKEGNAALIHWLKTLHASQQIDVLFCYLSGEQIFPETAKTICSLGVPSVNMYLNDKENFVGRVLGNQAMGTRDICRYFDLSWTSTEDALEKYCVEGARPLHLPEGANPELHRPHDLARDIDVSFVGQCYGRRPEIIASLRAAGIDAVAYGFGWPNGPLSTEEMVRLYSRTAINIGFGGVDGLTDTYCLKGRDFEVPMSGGLYLTEYNKELESVYRLGEEILTYRSIEELIAIIKQILADPQQAARIREAGMSKARSRHTWENRFQKIFSLMGLLPPVAG